MGIGRGLGVARQGEEEEEEGGGRGEGGESRCADRQLLRLEERGGIDAVGRKHFSS